MAEHNETGQQGEALAAAYLRDRGFMIAEVNWRSGSLEADIIASKGDLIIVAEVKTRKSNFFGEPESFVNRRKQQNLVKAANAYIEKKGLNAEVRFDILSVITGNGKAVVHHIEDAFYPIVNRK